ncbi:MAG: ANTAR domain-containing protein [Betaproteobacteria bacterium]|nr:ANTAR domain-containing protein [Betaproteobacteria bacterium]MDE2124927.1 ANTAR domain-containing protein [Betaproteobacteria bacterium]MDE2186664.1 ANTAR domain-containing protein [Betaproteobacteria bacterium]MDE2323544.1 ANTAR domain-containing protein [Betaproteobacteria bacterium]
MSRSRPSGPAPRVQQRSLKVAVISPDPALGEGDADHQRQAQRCAVLVQGLLDAGYEVVAVLPASPDLDERIAAAAPDLMIVDAESGVRDLLEHVVLASRDTPRPIVLFTDDDDTVTAQLAIAAGVTAYIVDGLKPNRVKPVIEVALARFEREQGLRAELSAARLQLSERKLVERAKGIVMQRQGCSEEDAFSRMRKLAMEKGLKLSDVAQRILDTAGLI